MLKVMKSLTYSLYKLPNTVFSAKDISLILREPNMGLVKSRINYYVKKGELIALRRGIYAKTFDYDKFELAAKIFTPSYISLETVLQKEGVIFQDYKSVFVVSYQTRQIEVDGQGLVFKKIKDEVLVNPLGLRREVGYFIASKERAFLDALYLYKDYYFDNLNAIDWEIIRKILPIYKNKVMAKRIKTYAQN